MFVFKHTGTAHREGEKSENIGIALLVLYSVSDALTSIQQETLLKGKKKGAHLFYISLSSFLISVVSFLLRGNVGECFEFLWNHPTVMKDIVILASCATVAKRLIYRIISHSGSFKLSLIMGFRQIVTLIVSSLYFKTSINMSQGLAALLVIGIIVVQPRA